MSLIRRIFRRLKTDLYRSRFESVARQVSGVKPLVRGDLPFTVLSMVQHRDVFAYLLAIRSFTLRLNPRRVVVVCDPTLTDVDRAVMTQQVPHIEFREAHEFRHPDIPIGGTWERLFAISGYAEQDYVVQLDADTLALGDLPEVHQAVMARHGFTIGECAGQGLMTFEQARENAAPWQSDDEHIQGVSEFRFVETNVEQRWYVRGCSGFTGFSPGTAFRANMLAFSREMHRLTGERWSEWGTEQVTSNYLVANSPGTQVLPFPDYATPDVCTTSTRFVHFIGSMRFTTRAYERAAATIISELLSGPSSH